MKELLKKIKFKEKRYVYPAIAFPIIILFVYQIIGFIEQRDSKDEVKQELSTGLGTTKDSLLSKNQAYDEFFASRDNRSMIGELDSENDSINYYSDNLTEQQKRHIDSLNYVRENERRKIEKDWERKNYYEPPTYQSNNNGGYDKDYERSAEIIRMLNNEASGNSNDYTSKQKSYEKREEEQDPVKMLRQQMLIMDSIEKAKDPEYQSKLEAENRLKKNKAKMKEFLNSTLKVSKAGLNPYFNSISKNKEDAFIKAVIDENVNKGYLGSRIRFRILEDIFVGKHRIPKGSLLYGQISGFETQRVKLNIVSILNNGEILPINLSIYDVDGIQGLYVPQSIFREMMRELGTNSIQGTSMDRSGESFFTSFLSRAFQSTSRTIANLIRTNKTKLKYNSYVYLINEQQLKNNNQYE